MKKPHLPGVRKVLLNDPADRAAFRLKRLRAFAGVALLIFAFCTLPGCGGGGGSRGAVVGVPSAASSIFAKLSGTIVDENDNTVSGVAITVNGSPAATSGNDGSFSADAGAVSASGSSIRLSLKKPGYEDAFPEIHVSQDSLVNGTHNVKLRLLRRPDTATEAAVAEILHTNGATETVAPVASSEGGLTVYNTTVNVTSDVAAVTFTTPAPAAGAAPEVSFTIGGATGPAALQVIGQAGAVSGSISYGDPTNIKDLESFPGSFTTTSDTGDGNTGQGALITAGFVTVTLKKADGTPITQFASGTHASIRMEVPEGITNPETGSPVRAGDTIPVFIFNETTGQWVVEHNADGSVKRAAVQQENGGAMFVQFTTTHLTTFNLDWKSALCPDNTPKVKFVDEQGNPVVGVSLYANIYGWYSYPRTVYDDEATFYRAPADIDWKIIAQKGDTSSEIVTIRSCKSATTNSGDIVLVMRPMKSYGEGSQVTIGMDKSSGTAPLPVSFDAGCFSAVSCEIFRWDFGDGGKQDGQYAWHNYMASGTYIITLTVTYSNGTVGKATDTITVSPYTGPGWYNKLVAWNFNNNWPVSYHAYGNGEVIVTGFTQEQNVQWSYWVAKYNSSGAEQWKYNIPDNGWADDAQPTADGGFIVSGSKSNPTLWKLNALGALVWEKTYPQYGYFQNLKQAPDGGYVVAGNYSTASDSSYIDIPYILKTDAAGAEVSNFSLVGRQDWRPSVVVSAKDGGYLIALYKLTVISDSEYKWEIHLEKRGSTGALAWELSYPVNSRTSWRGDMLQELAGGGCMFSYYTCDDTAGCLSKLQIINSSGQITGNKEYPNNFLYSISPAADGNYIFTFYDSFFKSDANGNLLWGKKFDDYMYYYFPIQQASDGGYLTFYENWMDFNKTDFWLFKFDSSGNGPGVTGSASAPRLAAREAGRPGPPQNPMQYDERLLDRMPPELKARMQHDPRFIKGPGKSGN